MGLNRPDTPDDHILGVLGQGALVLDIRAPDVLTDGDEVGPVHQQRGHRDEVGVDVILLVVGWNISGSQHDGPVGRLPKVPSSHIRGEAPVVIAWVWVVPVFLLSLSS